MAYYHYRGRNRRGGVKKGIINANTKRDAVVQLKEKGIAIFDLVETKPSFLMKDITIGNPVKFQEFVIFLRQFATLIEAGVSVVRSTQILAEQTSSKALSKVLIDIEQELRAGNPLSEAVKKHTKIFSSIVVNMILAGEVAGNLDGILEQLATYFEKQNHTKQKIISALTYPIVVAIIAVCVVIFLLTSVVPTFANMLASLGGELPAVTKFVLALSHFMISYWWLMLILGILIGITFYLIRHKSSSKYYFDHVILKVPIFGKLLQKAAIARMARTLGSLFSSSVNILEALTIVEKTVGNEVIAKVLRQSRDSLEKGQGLTGPMKEHWIFPPLVTQMIAIGEETGTLDAMLNKIAEFYEQEVDHITDRLKSVIEPLMIVFLSVIVGTIVISIVLPMFEIYKSIG